MHIAILLQLIQETLHDYSDGLLLEVDLAACDQIVLNDVDCYFHFCYQLGYHHENVLRGYAVLVVAAPSDVTQSGLLPESLQSEQDSLSLSQDTTIKYKTAFEVQNLRWNRIMCGVKTN